MGTRLELQVVLEGLLGSRNVYFQRPESKAMQYPAIVYNIDDLETAHAGNKPYKLVDRYQVTVIDKNPDSLIPKKVAALPMCTFDRFFVSDKLNHNVFKLFF